MILNKLELIRFYFRLYGLSGGLKFFLNLFCCGKEKIYCFDLINKTSIDTTLVNSNLNFKFIKNQIEFNQIKTDYISIRCKRLAEKDQQRLETKREYLGVIYKSNIFAGWGWVKMGPLRYGSNYLTKNDCIIHKCRTLQTLRRQRVYTTLLVDLLGELQQKGLHNVYIGAKSFNTPSLKAIEKTGFKFVEEFEAGSFVSRLLSHLKGSGTKVLETYDD